VREVDIGTHPLDRFGPLVGAERLEELRSLASRARDGLAGRAVWSVNSTAVGGGVAEMLGAILPYVRGAAIDARWVVIEGSPDFFRLTKRIHNALHGSGGDEARLGDEARRIYEAVTHRNAVELLGIARPGDVAILHDPQTAGLAAPLREHGLRVVWRCHIGSEDLDETARQGGSLLEPYLAAVDAFVFSRAEYVPAFCPDDRTVIIHPSIDPFSPKNQELDEATVRAILVGAGLVAGPAGPGDTAFAGDDGALRHVRRSADVIHLGPLPAWDRPLVVQVSRWDRLKDPLGVLEGFADLDPIHAYLVLAGPNVRGVADDPEGAEVFREVLERWRALPHDVRRHVMLASVPTADVGENGAIVNALQRHAAVVVQKSLAEGFGLTVTEAMWKGRAVVASAVGGIRDQIEDGRSGLLLEDPSDPQAFAHLLRRVLDSPEERQALGEHARERVRERFLSARTLADYSRLLLDVTRE